MSKNYGSNLSDLVHNINTLAEALENIENLAKNIPESEEFISYLRIAIASLRTGTCQNNTLGQIKENSFMRHGDI